MKQYDEKITFHTSKLYYYGLFAISFGIGIYVFIVVSLPEINEMSIFSLIGTFILAPTVVISISRTISFMEDTIKPVILIIPLIIFVGIVSNVEYAIENDDIIEQYPDDYPLPSVLLLGHNRQGEPLHIVCAPTTKGLIIITAYIPSREEWSNDWKTRLPRGEE